MNENPDAGMQNRVEGMRMCLRTRD